MKRKRGQRPSQGETAERGGRRGERERLYEPVARRCSLKGLKARQLTSAECADTLCTGFLSSASSSQLRPRAAEEGNGHAAE